MKSLQNKYPLVAISNGNVDTDRIDISKYFTYRFHAGDFFTTLKNNNIQLRQKPHTDMFDAACDKLLIKPSQLLHVGDCGYADIKGALNAGCQAAWLSCYDVGKPISVLPHIEIDSVNQLKQLHI